MYRENKKTKYSIRKLAVATVSLAIGATVAPAIAGTSQVAYAEEIKTKATQTINYVYEDGREAAPTKKISIEFQAGQGTVDVPEVESPMIPGFTPNKLKVEAMTLSTTQPDYEETITYYAKPSTNIKVDYQFVSSTPGINLPEEINDFKPTDLSTYSNGDTATPQNPTQVTYKDNKNKGTWTFNAYDATSKVVDKGEIKFVGVWDFEADDAKTIYEERYKFVSATPGKELPDEIKNSTPKVLRKYVKGDKLEPQIIEKKVYEVADGVWVLAGWERDKPSYTANYTVSKNIYNGTEYTRVGGEFYNIIAGKDNVEFTGYWHFFRNEDIKGDPTGPLSLERDFIENLTPEYELPQEVIDMYPPTIYLRRGWGTNGAWTLPQVLVKTPTGTWIYMTADAVHYPTQEDSEGKYAFGYREQIHGWAFIPRRVTYTFASGTQGKTLPEAIKNLVPVEEELHAKGAEVKAKLPVTETYDDVDNNGTWTFVGYNKNSDILGEGGIEFKGEWTFKPKAPISTIADGRQISNPEVTKVENLAQLTEEEKGKVEKAVKDANPDFPVGTTVTVGNNGDVTITYSDNSTDTIPGTVTVAERETSAAPTADKTTPNKPEKTVVADADQLTRDEKDQVAIEIGKANPDLPAGTSVRVADNGDVTITYPDGSENVVEKEDTVAKKTVAGEVTPNNPELTVVANPEKLTQEEKDQVAIEVGKANPELLGDISVTVADNGDVTITYLDGSVDTISKKNTVKIKEQSDQTSQPSQPVSDQTIAEQITPKDLEIVEVGDAKELTQEEKGKVEEAVKKANPTFPVGTKVAVAGNGDVTITYPDGSVDTISGENTVKEKVKPAGAKEKAKTLPNTGLTANNAVVAGLSILAVAALLAARRKNNK